MQLGKCQVSMQLLEDRVCFVVVGELATSRVGLGCSCVVGGVHAGVVTQDGEATVLGFGRSKSIVSILAGWLRAAAFSMRAAVLDRWRVGGHARLESDVGGRNFRTRATVQTIGIFRLGPRVPRGESLGVGGDI